MKKIKEALSSNRIFVLIFAAAAAASVVYILPPYDADIINYDSAYQFFLTTKSFPDMARLIPEDYSPPLYAFLLKLWTMIFGETLASMRAASLVNVWGMLFLAAFPIREAFGKTASLLCTVFFLFSSVNFVLIPEIRPTVPAYFLVTACAVYSYLAFFKEKKYAYVCLTVFSVLAMYTHNIGMLSALAIYITAGAMSLCRREFAKTRRFVISGAVCAVCYLPWLTVVFKQFGNVKSNYWSSGGLSLYKAFDWSVLSNLKDFGGNICGVIFPIALALTLCTLVIMKAMSPEIRGAKTLSDIKKLWEKYRERFSKALFLVLTLAGPVAAVALFSLVGHPIITKRYFYIFCGTAMLILAVLFSRCGKKAVAVCAAAMFAVNFSLGAFNLKKQLDSSDFIEMTRQIAAENPDGDIAFLHSHEWTLGIMMYYFPDARHYIFDDTWCVLNTYEVFPTEVINIGGLENMSEYEDGFYIFGGYFPDQPIALDEEYGHLEGYSCGEIGSFTEPYTYQKGWTLYYVKG